MDSLIVKLQRDVLGKSVLIKDAADGQILRECRGHEAEMIWSAYSISKLGKTYAEAEIDANGLLHLGNEVEEPQ